MFCTSQIAAGNVFQFQNQQSWLGQPAEFEFLGQPGLAEAPPVQTAFKEAGMPLSAKGDYGLWGTLGGVERRRWHAKGQELRRFHGDNRIFGGRGLPLSQTTGNTLV
jgi:hypothetical protein